MDIKQIQDDIIEEFALFDNNNDKYNYIIELGKQLQQYPEEARRDDMLIKGCQSKVWVNPRFQNELVFFDADSDSVLVKGLVSLLIRVLSGQSPEAITRADLYFMEQIGMRQMLSMNRSNGLAAMVKQLKLYALAFQAQKTI
jgi:cysteine desulfuration protein SufE